MTWGIGADPEMRLIAIGDRRKRRLFPTSSTPNGLGVAHLMPCRRLGAPPRTAASRRCITRWRWFGTCPLPPRHRREPGSIRCRTLAVCSLPWPDRLVSSAHGAGEPFLTRAPGTRTGRGSRPRPAPRRMRPPRRRRWSRRCAHGRRAGGAGTSFGPWCRERGHEPELLGAEDIRLAGRRADPGHRRLRALLRRHYRVTASGRATGGGAALALAPDARRDATAFSLIWASAAVVFQLRGRVY